MVRYGCKAAAWLHFSLKTYKTALHKCLEKILSNCCQYVVYCFEAYVFYVILLVHMRSNWVLYKNESV